MSPRFATSGQCRARIFEAPGSTSACQASRPPSTAWTPRSSPPYPEHRLPIVGPEGACGTAAVIVGPGGARGGDRTRECSRCTPEVWGRRDAAPAGGRGAGLGVGRDGRSGLRGRLPGSTAG